MPDERPPSSDDDPLIGTEVNATYRVVRQLGAGGMGTIYEVAHLHLPKRFALKLMLPEVAAEPVSFERFRREAVTASSLGNPHIAEVVDFNILPSGSPFLVMEYLEGEDLSARIASQGRLGSEEVASLVADLADALTAAHGRGILHRDLKPTNVYLARTPEGAEVVKLLDFGAAKAQRADELTPRGHVIGSPSYMSPEQARGQELDARSDEFSLSVLAYEALTGRLPFESDSPLSILFKIVEEPPAPITQYGVDAAVEEVLFRALSKDREARYPTVAEFAQALSEALVPLVLGNNQYTSGPVSVPEMRAVAAAPVPVVSSTSALSGFTSSRAPIAAPAPRSFEESPGRGLRTLVALALVVVALGGAYWKWGYLLAELQASHDEPVPAEAPPKGTTDARNEKPPVEPATASLSIDTAPPGAAVSVDGVPRGSAPVLVNGLGLGAHVVTVHRGDRLEVSRSVTLASPGESRQVVLDLSSAPTPVVTAHHESSERRPSAVAASAVVDAGSSALTPPPIVKVVAMGKLNLETTPSTTASEDGIELGHTPFTIPLPVGTHRLRLVNQAKQIDQSVEVVIKKDETTSTLLGF